MAEKFDLQKKYKEAVKEMLKEHGYSNIMSVPKIQKVVVNVGTGRIKDDKERLALVEKGLTEITGQKPSKRPAKKSIASFKLREGVGIGYSVSLRGKRMYDFLNKLIFVAIPRMRDFRGLDTKSIDNIGNLTVGFKDSLIFPEMIGQDLKNGFGFSVTIVTTAKNKDEAEKFLKVIGFPFSGK